MRTTRPVSHGIPLAPARAAPWLAAVALIGAGPALGCSICRCGDPTFNALGLTGVSLQGVRLALDWDSVEKDQGSAANEDLESAKEQRMTLLLGYSFSPNWGIYARLPRSERDLTETEDGELESTHSSGLADPELYAQRRLWSSPFDGEVGVRAALFAVAGVKTSWGDNDLSRDGERLDEHAQPGTGSTDWFGGLSGSYQLTRRSALFASVQYRATGENDAGYEYGNVVLGNFALEHKLATHWDGVVEANYRHAGRDRPGFGAELDDNTGGSALYLTPRLLVDLGPTWVLRASVQIPVATQLNGEQDEHAVYNLGITYLLKHGARSGARTASRRTSVATTATP
jgi:hypothetical protein